MTNVSILRRRAVCLLLTALPAFGGALTLSGCGGGGDSSNPEPGSVNTRVQVRIHWAERSRTISAPSSARSARLTLRGAAAGGGGDFVWVINRDTAREGYIRDYTSDDLARTGAYTLEAQFHTELNAQGPATGFVKATVRINPGGVGIPDLATRGTVARVVMEDRTVTPGQTIDLTANAFDEAGSLISLPAGAVFFFVESGAQSVRLNPADPTKLDALAPGTGAVRAIVDGVSSNVASFFVPVPETLSATDPVDPAFPNRGYVDMYRTAGLATGTAQVTMRSNSVNSYLIVYEIQPWGEWRLVAQDDDSAGGLNALVIFGAKAGWGYVIVCTSTVPGQTGPYTLVTSRELAAPGKM